MDLIVDKVVLSHDPKTLLHTLDMTLRIPLVISGNKKGASKDAPVKSLVNSLRDSGDLIHSRSLYSTVIKSSKIIPQVNQTNSLTQKLFYLTMVIRITSSNLWTSPYNDYQQSLFDIIRHQHEDKKMNFVQISNWLNENNYLTPRGKVFSQPLAWSIYTKKKRSINRFSRSFEPEIITTELDVVNSVPDMG